MILAALVMNTQGKPRITKFYVPLGVEKQQEAIRTIYSALSQRPEDSCSFVETEDIFGPDTKLVYKHFATLYFIFVIDSSESELGMLDLIQVFVETLDRCFKNVCELDIVYNFNKVNTYTLLILFITWIFVTGSEVMSRHALNPCLSGYECALSLSGCNQLKRSSPSRFGLCF
jgi:AP-3 complex subunit sigma